MNSINELIKLIKDKLLKNQFANINVKVINANEIELIDNKSKMILEVKDGKVTDNCNAKIVINSNCKDIFNCAFISSKNEFSLLIKLMNLIINLCSNEKDGK